MAAVVNANAPMVVQTPANKSQGRYRQRVFQAE
jgi:hypothetical protein